MFNIKRVTLIMVSLLLAVAAGPGLAGGPAPVQPGDLLASTGNAGNSLIELDPATAETSFRFDLGSFGPVTELRYRGDGVLFATTGQGTSNVITIDPDTGTETLVGQHQFGAVNGLAFIGETLYGSFYAVDEGDGPQGIAGEMFLVIVDQADGSLSIVGALEGFSRVRGLAYNPAAGILYGAGTPGGPMPVGEGPGGGDVLFTINPATAETSIIGDTEYGIGAISFGPDGQLYAGAVGGMLFGQDDTEGQPIEGAPLLTLNTSTGAATVIGNTEAPAISGLEFVPTGEQPEPASIAVPTLATWSLLLMALLLAMVGSRVLVQSGRKT